MSKSNGKTSKTPANANTAAAGGIEGRRGCELGSADLPAAASERMGAGLYRVKCGGHTVWVSREARRRWTVGALVTNGPTGELVRDLPPAATMAGAILRLRAVVAAAEVAAGAHDPESVPGDTGAAEVVSRRFTGPGGIWGVYTATAGTIAARERMSRKALVAAAMDAAPGSTREQWSELGKREIALFVASVWDCNNPRSSAAEPEPEPPAPIDPRHAEALWFARSGYSAGEIALEVDTAVLMELADRGWIVQPRSPRDQVELTDDGFAVFDASELAASARVAEAEAEAEIVVVAAEAWAEALSPAAEPEPEPANLPWFAIERIDTDEYHVLCAGLEFRVLHSGGVWEVDPLADGKMDWNPAAWHVTDTIEPAETLRAAIDAIRAGVAEASASMGGDSIRVDLIKAPIDDPRHIDAIKTVVETDCAARDIDPGALSELVALGYIEPVTDPSDPIVVTVAGHAAMVIAAARRLMNTATPEPEPLPAASYRRHPSSQRAPGDSLRVECGGMAFWVRRDCDGTWAIDALDDSDATAEAVRSMDGLVYPSEQKAINEIRAAVGRIRAIKVRRAMLDGLDKPPASAEPVDPPMLGIASDAIDHCIEFARLHIEDAAGVSGDAIKVHLSDNGWAVLIRIFDAPGSSNPGGECHARGRGPTLAKAVAAALADFDLNLADGCTIGVGQ